MRGSTELVVPPRIVPPALVLKTEAAVTPIRVPSGTRLFALSRTVTVRAAVAVPFRTSEVGGDDRMGDEGEGVGGGAAHAAPRFRARP